MLQTMFLCAGLGTRLLPLTRELPKALVPLGDRPILSHLVAALVAAGGDLRAVNTHHLADVFSSFINSYSNKPHVSHESELLGTAGGVKAALEAFERAPLLVWNSDIVTQPEIPALSRALDRARLVLAVEPQAPGRGNVGLDASGRVVRLRQRSVGIETSGGNYVGMLAMRPECFDALPERGCLIGDVAIPLMESSEAVFAIPHRARWSDLGTLETYLAENIRWLSAYHQGEPWVGSDAKVARDVELTASVVGSGAIVGGKGRLDRVVVWPGACCEAPLSNCIVTPKTGVVPVR